MPFGRTSDGLGPPGAPPEPADGQIVARPGFSLALNDFSTGSLGLEEGVLEDNQNHEVSGPSGVSSLLRSELLVPSFLAAPWVPSRVVACGVGDRPQGVGAVLEEDIWTHINFSLERACFEH